MLWDTGHDFVILVDTDPGNFWTKSSTYHHIEDKSAGNNKIYPQSRFQESVVNGTVWRVGWRHWVARIPNIEDYI
jgi:hypothetical protein